MTNLSPFSIGITSDLIGGDKQKRVSSSIFNDFNLLLWEESPK